VIDKINDGVHQAFEKGNEFLQNDPVEHSIQFAKDSYSNLKSQASDALDTVKDKAHLAKGKAIDAKDSLLEKSGGLRDDAIEFKDKLVEKSHELKNRAIDAKDRAVDSVSGPYKKAAFVASIAPYVSDTAADIQQQAKVKVENIKDQATDLKDRVVEKAKEKRDEIKDTAIEKADEYHASANDSLEDAKKAVNDKAEELKGKVTELGTKKSKKDWNSSWEKPSKKQKSHQEYIPKEFQYIQHSEYVATEIQPQIKEEKNCPPSRECSNVQSL